MRNNFVGCPRCGAKSFETLTTYNHCINCFYLEDRIERINAQNTDKLLTRLFNV